MVTDEERDYMNRVYAHDPQMRINLGIRRRLAPLLGNDRRKIELMNVLLSSLPGTPVIYYGDEIGMGDNVFLGDRNGVRTPMQWSADRNAGFSKANPQRLYLPVTIDPEYHYETINVEAQQNNPHSLLWWMKRLIGLRKSFQAFGRGSLEFLYPDNRKVLVFVRRYNEELILVVANLSRFVQCVELDLSAYQEMVPVELFSRMDFPPIGELPYFLTLGPHSSYMFALEPQRVPEEVVAVSTLEEQLSTLTVKDGWENVFLGKAKAELDGLLSEYLKPRRWFGGKARRIQSSKIQEVLTMNYDNSKAFIALVNVEYVEGEPETYVLPLNFATEERADWLLRHSPNSIVSRLELKDGGEAGLLHDALWEESFCAELLNAFARRRHFKGKAGELLATPTRMFRRMRGDSDVALNPSLMQAEQSNTSVVYGNRFILKLFRRIDEGVNPDLEIGLFLTERGFSNIPQVAGALEYRRRRQIPMTMGILQSFVPNQGDAWEHTLDALDRYFERALARQSEVQEVSLPQGPLLGLLDQDIPALVSELIGPYLGSAQLLGQRTAELHVALASDPDNPDFAPEPFSTLYQRSLYQSTRSLTNRTFQLLRKRLKNISEPARQEAQEILDIQDDILERFHSVLEGRISAMRIRCHGDYHLGQVLYTGNDFVIIDFEGEPAIPLSERRLKRSPLRDVAGMLRSFHYAVYSALLNLESRGMARPEGRRALEAGAELWHVWVSVTFLKGYLEAADEAEFLPKVQEELQVILDLYLLEKAVYEVSYELNNRPDWLRIPFRGIRQLMNAGG
jgi:maltose alpha-D-glucosyltransferase/alpha-amylase